MKRTGIVYTMIVLGMLAPQVVAAQQFQFAPDRTPQTTERTITTQTKVTPTTTSKTATTKTTATSATGSFDTQLEVIDEWEKKVVAVIPQSIKDKVNTFDVYRQDLAKKYEALRDVAGKDATIAIKGKPTQGNVSVAYDAGPGFYWYAALALFFGKMYLFYGAILIGAFVVLRVVLRYFNVII